MFKYTSLSIKGLLFHIITTYTMLSDKEWELEQFNICKLISRLIISFGAIVFIIVLLSVLIVTLSSVPVEMVYCWVNHSMLISQPSTIWGSIIRLGILLWTFIAVCAGVAILVFLADRFDDCGISEKDLNPLQLWVKSIQDKTCYLIDLTKWKNQK